MIYSINEGQQAEEYKIRKHNELMGKIIDGSIRYGNRYQQDHDPVGNKKAEENIKNGKLPTDGMTSKEKENWNKKYNATNKAQDKVIKDFDRRGDEFHPNKPGHADAMDAANRHARRHPKQYKEGTIFESVEFI